MGKINIVIQMKKRETLMNICIYVQIYIMYITYTYKLYIYIFLYTSKLCKVMGLF